MTNSTDAPNPIPGSPEVSPPPPGEPPLPAVPTNPINSVTISPEARAADEEALDLKQYRANSTVYSEVGKLKDDLLGELSVRGRKVEISITTVTVTIGDLLNANPPIGSVHKHPDQSVPQTPPPKPRIVFQFTGSRRGEPGRKI